MEVMQEVPCMALKCLVEHSDSRPSDPASSFVHDGTVKFAIVPASVTVAELLKFVLQHLDIKVNPSDCAAQLQLPNWKGLILTDICAQPEIASAVSLLSQISNIATLRIILPAQESSILPSSVMRNLLKSLIPQHTCSLATQVAWFKQAGCPLSDAIIEAFLASPDDFEFSYRARREFSDWHSRVCLQYLEQVSRSCQPLGQVVTFTLGLAPMQAQLPPPPEPPRDAADETTGEPTEETTGEADASSQQRSGSATVSALGRLTEHFRSTSSRQKLKAARRLAAAAATATTSTDGTQPQQQLLLQLQPDSSDADFPDDLSESSHNNNHATHDNDSNSERIGNGAGLLGQDNENLQEQPPQQIQFQHLLPADRRRRTRVFIDPSTEIPQLESWFAQESHPTSAQFALYARTLNSMPFRQKQPSLEAKNVQLWFKNHRAKVKRERLEVPPMAAESVTGTDCGLALPLVASSPSNSDSAYEPPTVEAAATDEVAPDESERQDEVIGQGTSS